MKTFKTYEQLAFVVGKVATLKKKFRCPKDNGKCVIVGPSRHQPGCVIVEWDDYYPGHDISILLLSFLDVEE